MKSLNNILKEIKELIEALRIYIQNDGGDMEFVKYENGVLTIRILGACVSCPFVGHTFDDGVKNVFLRELPEIKDVVFIQQKK